MFEERGDDLGSDAEFGRWRRWYDDLGALAGALAPTMLELAGAKAPGDMGGGGPPKAPGMGAWADAVPIETNMDIGSAAAKPNRLVRCGNSVSAMKLVHWILSSPMLA